MITLLIIICNCIVISLISFVYVLWTQNKMLMNNKNDENDKNDVSLSEQVLDNL